jgi:hypothetical protein
MTPAAKAVLETICGCSGKDEAAFMLAVCGWRVLKERVYFEDQSLWVAALNDHDVTYEDGPDTTDLDAVYYGDIEARLREHNGHSPLFAGSLEGHPRGSKPRPGHALVETGWIFRNAPHFWRSVCA